jgi:hypothetical protein
MMMTAGCEEEEDWKNALQNGIQGRLKWDILP